MYRLGDDEAFRDTSKPDLTFRIGDKAQTREEFDLAVIRRFGNKENFQEAWDEALKIMVAADRSVLESRNRFYGEVYKPRRDELSDIWSEKYSPKAEKKGSSRKPSGARGSR